MITVEEAERIILENTISLPTEEVAITDAIGRILAEELRADRDFPPFDRVTMDGIAINFEQLSKGVDTFPIESVSRAGSPLVTLQNPANCVEVMTGTMLPANTDTVIRYEDLEIKDGLATVKTSVEKGQNIHCQGFDRKAGDLIIEKGRKISSAEVGVAATIGKSTIKVNRTLKAIIVSTGDEIVPITQTPERHQIRTSNGYALQALLKQWGVAADNVLLPDNQEFIESEIKRYIQEYDTIILSGGVSAGKFDFVPKALENQGVKKLFHKVEQRPGKPFWFGATSPVATKVATAVFALPGNPVSTFMCLNRYFKKWLDASLGIQTQQLFAELAQDFNFKPDLTFFLQVKLQYNLDGKILAKPIEGHGSGDLANLADADAFIELPKEKTSFKKGESYKIYIYRN
jgi:molybdopterin molybdotransferase